MSEAMSLIDNSSVGTVKPSDHEAPDDGSLEYLSPIVNSPFRKIEFHLATAVTHGGGGGPGTFQLERLNPTTSNSNNSYNDQHGVAFEQLSGGSLGKKRDASELDVENSFGITFRRIGAGLENLGNTCFLNSVLQCLTYTEPLAAYLQSGKHQITCRNAGFCALCAIQKHVSRALRSSGKSLAPKDLVSNLRYISQTFRSSRQEDAHEYMVNLLESMHRCCLPLGLPSESPCAYERSLVHNIFGGRLRSQVKCMQCTYCSNKFEPFLDLSLEILEADTLYKAFADFTCKEQLDGGAKQYQCEQCKQKVKALKQLTIHEAPNVLTIHLKRFGCHISGQKIDKKVHFSLTLDLKPFVTGPYDGDLRYTLYGVLVHIGWSTHSGHYYCFVRTSSGMWYSLDDSQVIQVSEKTVFEQKAYMLFYVRDRKNFPSKKPAAHVVHQQETGMNTMEQSNACSIIREGKTKDTLESPAQKGMPESCSESDMVNLASVHETTKSDMLIATNDAMKVPSNSLCDVAQKLSPMNDKNEACLTMLQEHKDKRSTHEDFSNSMAVTICSKPEMAPGGSACVADEDVAISEPYSADGGGDDSWKRVVTSMGKENFSIDEKVVERKRQKKVKKKHLKMKVTSRKFCWNILVGASRNKKRHKRKKRIKNVDVSRMKSDKTSDVCIENKFNERAYEGGSVRGLESCRSLQHKTELIRILTADRTVPRWDEDDVASIGYVGDEGEEEYEQEKRKEARKEGGRKERKRKRKRKQAERWRSDNRPFRI